MVVVLVEDQIFLQEAMLGVLVEVVDILVEQVDPQMDLAKTLIIL